MAFATNCVAHSAIHRPKDRHRKIRRVGKGNHVYVISVHKHVHDKMIYSIVRRDEY